VRDGDPRLDGRSTAPRWLRRPGTWLALLAYAAVVVALTWPLAPRGATHIAATHGAFHIDTLHTAWMLSHESRALTDASTSLLEAGIYHPEHRTLFYSTTSLGLLPLFAPIFLATGNPVLALDVAFLACVALTAWMMHVVVVRWTGDRLAAAFAGLAYLSSTTPLRGFPAAAPYFAVLMYVPLVMYAAATPTSWLAAPPLLAALIALQCLTEPLYVAPVVLVPLVTIALARLARASTRRAGLRLATALVLAAVVLLPIYAGYADVVLRNPHLGQQSVYGLRDAPAGEGSSRPSLAFVVYAYVVGSWYWYPISVVALATIVVGFAAARRSATPPERVAWRHCALWSALVFVLPMLRQWVPLLRGLHRARILDLVSLGMLAGLAVAACSTWVSTRYGRRSGRLVAVGLLVALIAYRPFGWIGQLGAYPTQPAPDPASPVIAALRAGRGPVLEIPYGRPDSDAFAVYRTIFHRRPLVNGYSSYFPAAATRRLALIRRLPDPLALALLRTQTGITTVVVSAGALNAREHRAWDPVLADLGARPDLHLALEHEGVRVLDVTATPPARQFGIAPSRPSAGTLPQ
jgi:hypothetical protein